MGETINVIEVNEPKPVELNADQKFTQLIRGERELRRDDYPCYAASDMFREKYGHYPSCEDWENMSTLFPEAEVRAYQKQKLQERFKAIAKNRADKRNI